MRKPLLVFALTISLMFGPWTGLAGAGSTHAAGYAAFEGGWYHHGTSLEITGAGRVYAAYRTYVWCGAGQRFGCDRMVGNAIDDGGLWAAMLGHSTSTTARGTITASSNPALDGRQITLSKQPQGFLLLTWSAPGFPRHIVFCGPKTPPTGKCGA